ncbi:hypothetical protein [Nocardia sp. NPDC051833]|uniref:DUF7373 family lipoprotein n=1 Tax=Nocardia sp. NPDC051833 TaxID=3155674 RepID=UPI003417B138
MASTIRLKNALKITTFVGVLLLPTSCGSTVTGTGQPGNSDVDLTSLRTGPFQTDPLPFEVDPYAVGSETIRQIEGTKLLGYLAHPFDVDIELTSLDRTRVFIDKNAIPADSDIKTEHQRVIKDNMSFVAGVSSRRTNSSIRSPKELEISVMRFATGSDSIRAATEFHSISVENGGRPTAGISRFPGSLSTSSDDTSIVSWMPHGPYVIMVGARVPKAGSTELLATAEKSLQLQTELLDRQSPMALDEVLNEPLDAENIVRRSMIRDDRDPQSLREDPGMFDRMGILHYERNPIEARKKFEEAGVDLIGRRASTVYRTRDLPSAFLLQTFLAKPGKNDTVLDPPFGLLDAQCLKLDVADPNRKFDAMCAVVFDRYVAVVTTDMFSWGSVDRALQERASAQYAILKKCG